MNFSERYTFRKCVLADLCKTLRQNNLGKASAIRKCHKVDLLKPLAKRNSFKICAFIKHTVRNNLKASGNIDAFQGIAEAESVCFNVFQRFGELDCAQVGATGKCRFAYFFYALGYGNAQNVTVIAESIIAYFHNLGSFHVGGYHHMPILARSNADNRACTVIIMGNFKPLGCF